MIDELKRRARAGDLQALQELRERGFFGSATAPTRSYEVSAAQRRMWILDQTSGVGSAYNIARALTIQGELDRAALGRALNAIVERHESLRTTFTSVGDEPRQVVHPVSPFSMVEIDLRGEGDPLDAARRLAADDAPRPFDLKTGPLLRVHLLRTGEAEQVLLFNAHHIVCDAWSLDNIVRELTALYRGDALPPLARQYKDFAVWHNEWLRSARGDESRRYWRRTLAAPLPVLDLPTDRRRTSDSSWAGRAVTLDLGDALTAGLTALAKSEGTTVFTALVAVTKALLHLESGQEDIIVGAPVAGRDQAEVEPLIGVFANAVALRDRITPATTVRALVRRVRRTIEDAFAHQGMPFDELVNELAVERNPSRTPIFDVLVGLLNTERNSLELGGLTLADFETGTEQSPHDLVLYFSEGSGTLHVSVLYRMDLFDDQAIRRLVDRWVRIAALAIASPDSRIGGLDAGEAALHAPRPITADIGGAQVDLDRLAGRIVREAGVADAVVISMAGEDHGESLVAFVVPGDGAPAETIRARVMTIGTGITRVVTISTLPLTGDGRVNVRTLERLADEALRPAPHAAPQFPLHVWDLVPRTTARAIPETAQARTDSATAASDREAPSIATGPNLVVDANAPWTLGAALMKAAATSNATITYVSGDGVETTSSYEKLADEARRIATSIRDAGGRPGSPIILLLSDASDVLPAFWGAVFAGVIPLIASPPPDFSSANRPLDQLTHLWTLLERPLIVTTRVLTTPVLSLSRLFDVTPDRVLAIDNLRQGQPLAAIHEPQPDDVAFFSLTSGSTGRPKCVMLTHRNVLARARGMNQLCGCGPDEIVLNWLPLDHIGSLSKAHLRSVDLGCSAVYLPTATVLSEPLQWLAALDRHRVTHSWAPNFAYALVTEALRARTGDAAATRYDLSCVRGLVSGGEAVTASAVASFLEALAPFGLAPNTLMPAYGMAEMASGVTYAVGRARDQAARFHRIDRTSFGGKLRVADDHANAAAYADVGPPIGGVSLRIVDETGAPLPEWHIGRLQVSGPPIAKGYYRDAEATRAVFFADGWFETGDHGFLANGSLALTGRAKDGIIVNGANYSSAEIESAVESVDDVATSFAAAIAVRPSGQADEALAIVYVANDRQTVRQTGLAIREAVLEKVGLKPEYLIPVRRDDIPKTAIGKIQRPHLTRRFEAGHFDEIVKSTDLEMGAGRTLPDWFSSKTWHPAQEGARREPGAASVIVGGDAALAARLSTRLNIPVDSCYTLPQLAGLLKPLAAAERDRPITVMVVTIGGQALHTDDDLRGDRAAWSGLVVSLAQECPWLDLRIVDLEADEVEANVARCLDELGREGGGRISAWRNGRRFVPRLSSAEVAIDAGGTPAFSNGSLILVTGGAGGIGRHLVRHLRDAYDARVLVIGRQAAADRTAPSDPFVRYQQADVCNRASLDDAVDAAESAFGRPLAGAFHLAGVLADRPLTDETPGTISAVFQPKAQGALTLAELIRKRIGPTGVLVTFSSVNGLFGGAGASAYSAANAFVDALADQLRTSGQLRCWNLAWSMWDDTGMSRGFALREATRAKGFTVLRPDAALIALDAVLLRPPASVWVGLDLANPRLSPVSGNAATGLRDAASDDGESRIAPRTEAEKRLARIWEDLLGVSDIAIHDHFVRLGGHSLKATQLVARIQKEFDTRVSLQDVFRVPTIAGLATVVEAGTRDSFASIEPAPLAAHYPASHSQRRLWVIEQMGLAGAAYHIESATGLEGDIDATALRSAVDAVVARHEALRTTFVEVDGEPRQVVHGAVTNAFAVVDVSGATEPDAEARAMIRVASATPFDLTTGPLFRATLYRLSPHRATLVLTMHHIVSDGWSMDIIVRELLDGYEQARRGGALALPPLRIHYKDFAAWQQRALAADASGHRDYWLNMLSGELPIIDLPADRARPPVQSFRGSVLNFTIEAETGEAMRLLAQQHGATAFMAWLTVVRLLVFRYTRATDAIVATPVAGREHVDLADQVGFYVNMLPLRIPVSPDISAGSLLERIKTITTGAIAHQLYPYDRVVEELGIKRDAGRNPLFDVVVSVTEARTASALPGGLAATSVDLEEVTSKFDVTFFFVEKADGGWHLGIEYNCDLFSDERIRRMGAHVAALAASVARQPNARLSDLDLLPAAERRALTVAFPAEPSDYPRDRSIAAVFEEQVLAAPDRTATLSSRGTLTYRELDAHANGLARALLERGLRLEEPVAVLMAPSEWTAVALLGILKAGGAYVPLDPSHPAARRDLMLADAGCRLVVTDGTLFETGNRSLELVDVRSGVASEQRVAVERDGASLAYIMFTSGSTGRPKGSLIEQRAILRLVKGANFVHLGPDDRLLQAGSLAFDASTFEFWGPLLNGGCVCVPAAQEILDPDALQAMLVEWRITTMWCTAGLFNQMVDANVGMFAGLRQVIAGGERLSPSHVRQFRQALPHVRLINGYGPTENTTFTACHTIAEDDGEVPLGRPVSNSTVYVLDPDGNPSPIGVPGEICAGGDGLARGYLNDPLLTAERFVPHPFRLGERLYRTGDAGRWRADGVLEFAGRIDQQLKIRGYRVEPGEIETAIGRDPRVDEVVVVARPTMVGTLELVAYFTSAETLAPSALRAALADALPGYMVPAHWVQLDRLPLNASLKVDRAALPPPAPSSAAARPDRAHPRTAEEHALAEGWAELLGGTPGIHDNYFELGGDSIRAIQLASRLRRRGWRLQVRDVFTHPTIAGLASRLHPLTGSAETPERRDTPGPVPMTAAQQWFFAHHRGPLEHFNQAVLLTPRQAIDEGPLRASLSALVDQHDALRLMFPVHDGRRVAEIRPRGEPAWLDAIDLRSAADAPQELATRLDEMHQGFDLERGPLFRAALVQMPEGQRVWLAAHHLVVDGVSWRVLIEQLSIAYGQASRGAAVDVGEPSASFRDRAEEAAAFASSQTLAEEMAAWSEHTAAGEADDRASTYGSSVALTSAWSAANTALLLSSVHQAYGTEINDLLLAALGRAAGDWSGAASTTIDLEGHGREPLLQDVDLTRTVGWFTSIFPVALPARSDYRDQIRDVKETLRAIPRRGAGYGIHRYSRPNGHTTPLPSISFNYLGHFDLDSQSPATPPLFDFAPEPAGAVLAPALTRAHAFDLVAMVSGGQLNLTVMADARDRDRAQALIDEFDRRLRSVVAHCIDRPAERTPSDFTAAGLTVADYDRLLSSRGWRASEVEDICPATPMQEGLLLLSVLDPGSPAYRVQMAYTLTGPLDSRRFEDAWRAVCRAHPVLRSAFAHEGLERPLRVVLRDRLPPFSWHDLRELDSAAQTARVRDARDRDLATGVDFERDPLMRFTVFRLADERWEIVWSYHHVLLDGWSLGLVFRDFAASYGGPDDRPALALPQGADPAEYSRWLARQHPEDARAWWSNYLAGYDQAAVLPPASIESDGPRGDEYTVALTTDETTALAAIAGQWGVTQATLVLAAWGMVLSRYNRVNDVVFGSIVSGRPAELADADRMVGAFINAVPVRVRTAGSKSLRDLAARLQSELAAAEQFHHTPLAEIQDQSALGRELFSHMVIVENYPVERQLATAGQAARLQIEGLDAHDRTHYSFAITVVPGDALTVGFQFDASRHDRAQVERTAGHYLRVLRAFSSAAQLDDLELMSDAEHETVTRRFQPARRAFSPTTVVDLLAAQVARTPDRIAVASPKGAATYRELADAIAELSVGLADAGAGTGDRVGVLLERSAAVPGALFGVLRAGAAYVPLDPDYPQARVRFMLEDSGCRFLVASERSLRAILIPFEWREVGRVRDLILLANAPAAAKPSAPVSLDDPAYVMYTSGSTGTPKGVVIPHRALSSQTQWFIEEFELTQDDRFFHKTPISFDASVEEIYATLLAGGTVVIPGRDEHLDLDRMAAALVREGITLVQAVPSQLAVMLDAGWNPVGSPLRLLAVGSEPLDASVLARLPANRTFDVVNLYGPTETCDNATAWRWDGRTAGRIPIGVPVANTSAYVLDDRLRPVPLGIYGEICLGGDNLAIGYHDRPELTADRFVIAPTLGERIYRTGDLGRWTDAGVLECAGRIDQQVKIRGHRIECGEIEGQLRLHPAVQDAAVVITRHTGQPELVAFYVERSGTAAMPAPRELRLWLKERLLEAMVPARMIPVSQLPVMPNGKVDRRALEHQAAVPGGDDNTPGTLGPRDANEAAIAGIWAGVLGTSDPDIRANFFEAGGHSLKAMQIVSRIHRDLGIRVSLRDLFDHPTIEGLAALARPADRYSAIEPAPPQATYALSHAQQRLWLLHHIPGGEAAYNMPSAFWLEGSELDADALERAFASLVDRHEALRTAFAVVDGEPRQQILPAVAVTLTRVDLRNAPDADAQALALAEHEALQPFDLAVPPLLRVTAITMPGASPRTVILLTIHHIVGDGWSGEILEREISALYEAFRTGGADPLPPLRIQYKDFSEWQNQKTFDADEAWWLGELDGIPDRLVLPTDFEPADDRDFRGAVEELVLDAETTTALVALAARRSITVSHAVLALFMLSLNRLSGQNDVCVGMSVANRNHPDLERLIGFFVNVLPIRARFTDGMDLDQLLDRVAATATAALDRQDYPFDLLVRRLNPSRAATRQPLVNVVYAFQNFTDVRMDVGAATPAVESGASLRSFEFEFRTSKFDLTLFVVNQGDTLRLTLEYDTGLFTAATIRRHLALLARFTRMASTAEETRS